MSRIRTVKPELFKHEELFEAEQKEQLPLRLAFIALLTCCDREGRFRWQPRRLGLDMLPYDEINLSCVLDALAYHGFIKKYEHEGKYYGCIPSWKMHQQINNKESASTLPSLQRSTVVEIQIINPHATSDALSVSTTPKEIANVLPTPQDLPLMGAEIHTPEVESTVPNLVSPKETVEIISTSQQPIVIESGSVNSAATLTAIVSKFFGDQKKADVLLTSAKSLLVEEQITTHTAMPPAEEPHVVNGQGTVSVMFSPQASMITETESLTHKASAAIKNDCALNLPLVPIASSLNLNKTLGTCEPRVNHASLTPESRVNHALNTEKSGINHACSEDSSGKEREGNGKGKEGERNGSIVTKGTRGQFPIEAIAQIFEHWKTVMNYPNARLDDARKIIIRKALSAGYSSEQLCYAIRGCSVTPHNMGDNERGQRFDGLHVILRDADQIDRFIRHYQEPPRARTEPERRTNSNIQALQHWIDSKMQEKELYARA